MFNKGAGHANAKNKQTFSTQINFGKNLHIWISAENTGKKSGLKTLTEEEEEDKRIAELGKPRLGEYKSVEIIIEESYEFKVSRKIFHFSSDKLVTRKFQWASKTYIAMSMSLFISDRLFRYCIHSYPTVWRHFDQFLAYVIIWPT